MSRRRVTEFLPFLLPLRRKQKIWCFYQKMKHDSHRYARHQADNRLPYLQYECTQGLINPDSGYDIQYQYNKAHNLKVVSRRMQQLIIEPGEVFSFWQLARGADHDDPYLPGLGLHDGKIVPVHGGGLCFMSELLYWMVLHTPLTVIEKHPHLVISLPANPNAEMPAGIDATIQEGWSDLKFRNDTDMPFQLILDFDEASVHAQFRCGQPPQYRYEVSGSELIYSRKKGKIFRTQQISRTLYAAESGEVVRQEACYTSRSRIDYPLSADTEIIEEDEA